MATWTKLRDGSWGVRGKGLATGEETIVEKRDGSRQAVIVGRILWTGDDGTQIATAARSVASVVGSGHRSGRRCDCSDGCCDRGCRCDRQCNCQGGPIYDC